MTNAPAPARPLQAFPSGDLIDKYVALRDAKDAANAAAKKAADAYTQQLGVIEAELNARMNADGVDSIKATAATVYYVSAPRPKCKDWDAFFKFAEASGRADLLQKRLSKGAIETYMEDNDNALPPGVIMETYRDVRVRKN